MNIDTRPRTVVVHHHSGIGDLIWHVPYFRAIAADSRDGRISVIARPSCRAPDLLAGQPWIEEILEFDRKPRASERRRGRHDSLLAQLAFVGELRKRQFERMVVFSGRVRYGLFGWLAGIGIRAGFGFSAAQRLFLNHPPFIERHRGEGSWVYPEATALAVAHGWVAGPQVPRLEADPERQAALAIQLAELPRPRHALILGASEARKQWGAERFAALAQALCARGLGVLLVGGPGEAALAAEIRARIAEPQRQSVAILAGPPLADTAAALSNCDFALGNDTGALNLAAALGLPCLGLFGATRPLSHDPQLHGLAADSMDAISVERVLSRLNELAAPGFAERELLDTR